MAIVVIGVISLLLLTVTAFAAPTAKGYPKLPKIISITSYPIGAHGAFLAITFSEAITKMTGVKVRPLPADADLGRFLPVKNGDAEAAVVSSRQPLSFTGLY